MTTTASETTPARAPGTVPALVGLRIAIGEEFDYWRDTYPEERHYARFERLEYQTEDGAWHTVPQVWVGRYDSQYNPEQANDSITGGGTPYRECTGSESESTKGMP